MANSHVPNMITLVRIMLIPVFLAFLLYHYYTAALYTFVLAGVTDMLDGYLARRLRSHTEIGRVLDPLADKLLLTASFVVFTYIGWVPVWFTVTVISRDLFIVIGWLLLFLMFNTSSVQPSRTGKLAIALQMFLVGYTLLHNVLHSTLPFTEELMLATAAMTVISGFQYIYRGLNYQHAENR